MKFFLTLVLLILSLGNKAFAQTFEYEGNKFSVDMPTDWENAQGLFGIPFSFLAPQDQEDQSRPLVAIVPMGKGEVIFDKSHLKDSIEDYKNGRLAWLQKRSAELVKFEPYQNLDFNGAQVHSTGYKYKLNDTVFAESTYYISCSNKVYNIKTLIRESQQDKYQKQTDELVRSFKCI